MSSAKINAISSNRPFSRSDRQRLFSGAVSSGWGDGVIEGRGRLRGGGDWEMGRMGKVKGSTGILYNGRPSLNR
jgi:hypothetical protein